MGTEAPTTVVIPVSCLRRPRAPGAANGGSDGEGNERIVSGVPGSKPRLHEEPSRHFGYNRLNSAALGKPSPGL